MSGQLSLPPELGTFPLFQRSAPTLGAPSTTDPDLAAHDLRRMGDNVPASQFVEADLRFHMCLVDSIGSPRFSRFIERSGRSAPVHGAVQATTWSRPDLS